VLSLARLRRRGKRGRGQAIVEAALFCPLLLLALAALLLFSRLGVVAERGESAVRYADLVTFRHGQIYTVATVYDLLDELLDPSASQLGPLCLTPNATTSVPPPQNTISAAALQAFTESQPAVSSTAVPATRNFWKPDSMAAPVCNPMSVQLSSSTYGLSDMPLSVTSFQVQGTISVPGYLNSLLGSQTSTTANMAFLNLATPNMLVACVPGMSVVIDVLSDMKSHGTPNCNAALNSLSF
jgi:hypothetical protein